jgi:hypothetical protein
MIPEKMSFSDKTSDLECKKVEAVETWFYVRREILWKKVSPDYESGKEIDPLQL